jgi:hypothetical protein
MRRIVLAAFALTVLAACQPATTELTHQQRGEIAAEVELLHGQLWDAWREVDVDRAMSYYRNSPDFVWADNGELMNGWTPIYEGLQTFNAERQAITFNESKTMVLGPNVVQFVEQGTYSVTDTTGATRPEVEIAASTLWVLRDGEWKVDFIHVSNLRP